MKVFKYLFLLIVVFTSCKSNQNLIDKTSSSSTKISAKKILKKHNASNFDKQTIETKLKVNFKNEKQNLAFSVRMKIKKDEVIWLKGSKLITIFKAKLTPNKISFYSPYYKNYIEGDYNMLEQILGVSVNFNQLQNILLGQAMFDTSKKHIAQYTNKSFKINPKKQLEIFDVFYWINEEHYKLNKQSLISNTEQKRLDINYPSYKMSDNTLFPESIKINGKTENKQTNIDLLVKSIIFNQEISIPFSIPEGYKEIKF